MSSEPGAREKLLEVGWKQTGSGKWIHTNLPALPCGRRRVFSEGQALTLLEANEVPVPVEEEAL